MKTFIYILIDPISNQIRYVGKSINPKVRLRKHINESKNSKNNNHRINWIKSLLNKNEKPIMEIIDEGCDDNWIKLEQYWISQFITWGFDLVNGTNGGEKPPSFKGKKLSDEHKLKLKKGSQTFFNSLINGLPDEWRENISKAHKLNEFIPLKAIEANKKDIYQFTLDGKFIKKWDSITSAAKFVNLKSHNGLMSVCENLRFKAGGFRWSYTEKLEEHFKKTINVKQISLNNELIKIWYSVNDAATQLKINESTIRKICNGRGKTAGGFKWSY